MGALDVAASLLAVLAACRTCVLLHAASFYASKGASFASQLTEALRILPGERIGEPEVNAGRACTQAISDGTDFCVHVRGGWWNQERECRGARPGRACSELMRPADKDDTQTLHPFAHAPSRPWVAH